MQRQVYRLHVLFRKQNCHKTSHESMYKPHIDVARAPHPVKALIRRIYIYELPRRRTAPMPSSASAHNNGDAGSGTPMRTSSSAGAL